MPRHGSPQPAQQLTSLQTAAAFRFDHEGDEIETDSVALLLSVQMCTFAFGVPIAGFLHRLRTQR